MNSRLLSAAMIGALIVALAAPLMLLARAIDDPIIGVLTALIVFVTGAPFLARGSASHHPG